MKFLIEKFHNFNASRELKIKSKELRRDSQSLDPAALVELLYSPKWERFFWTKQVKSEFIALAREIESITPKVVVEVGTNTGGTLFAATKLAATEATVISIDLPGGKGGGGYPNFKLSFFNSFAGPQQKIHLLRADSHQASTISALKSILGERTIDYLFLDGDHSYEGIQMDFSLYSPFVRDGGIVAFHDIKPYPQDHWIKADKFWNQVKLNYQHKEFLDNSVHWGGIGVLIYEKK